VNATSAFWPTSDVTLKRSTESTDQLEESSTPARLVGQGDRPALSSSSSRLLAVVCHMAGVSEAPARYESS
jgi:hypothetical protein